MRTITIRANEAYSQETSAHTLEITSKIKELRMPPTGSHSKMFRRTHSVESHLFLPQAFNLEMSFRSIGRCQPRTCLSQDKSSHRMATLRPRHKASHRLAQMPTRFLMQKANNTIIWAICRDSQPTSKTHPREHKITMVTHRTDFQTSQTQSPI